MIWALAVVQAMQMDSLESRVKSGKSHYEFYKTSGSCWESAVLSMSQSCNTMNEASQSLFAVKLTNCHLKRLGLKELTCEIGKCELDSNTYIAYTQFFTHSFDICVYLSYHHWQMETQKTIDQLSTVSEEALKLAQISNLITKEILEKQFEMKMQVDKSKAEMTLFVAEFINTTETLSKEMNKQQEFIAGWFQKIYVALMQISNLHEDLMSQVWEMSSFVFFLVSLAFLTAITSFPETFNQRTRVFLISGVEIIFERSFGLWLRYIRTSFLALCLLVVAAGVKRYRNYESRPFILFQIASTPDRRFSVNFDEPNRN